MSGRSTKGLVVPDDVLLGVFAYYPDESKRFCHDSDGAQVFFHERCDVPVVSRVLRFKNGYSSGLNQAYSNLVSTGFVGIRSLPAGRIEYQINPVCLTAFNGGVRGRFSGAELASLRTLASEFYEAFGAGK